MASHARRVSTSASPVGLRFGQFEYDSQRHELKKFGVRVRIQRQPLAILLTLLESPGSLVTREELRSRLWDSATFVAFEHGLNSAVKRLRDVLCDSADQPRYIETVAGEGYRFIAGVEQVIAPVIGLPPAIVNGGSGVNIPAQTSADAMAQELRTTLLREDSDVTPCARVMSRLIVLPFRVLRPDPETDFLAFSLPDAITSSLSGLESLIVRSSLAAARFAGEAPDLKTIAVEADVDVVLTGTLLTSGGQLRVSTQLMETPSGALIWSKTSQVALRDIFQLQDDLVNRIVESLSLPLTAREHRRLKHDVPASSTAYECYLRGNLLYYDWAKMSVARDLYLRCVEEDPQYAPAWARLGRCHRLIAKWSGKPEEDLVRAKNALARALQLSPDLPVAHHLHALLEADLGHAQAAMVRLLGRAGVGSNDPELFAGLTQVCRYCGLLEASLAAHKRARRLDPQIRTSVAHTHFMLGDYGAVPANSSGGDHLGVHPLALSHLRREREALELLRKGLQEQLPLPVIRWVGTSILALLEGRPEESVQQSELFVRSCRDPEGFYYFARQLAYLGKHARALELLTKAVKLGYVCFPTMARDPWLDPLRGNPEFTVVRRAAETRYREAAQAFLAAAGGRILGVRPT